MNKTIKEKMLVSIILVIFMTNFLTSNFCVYAEDEETIIQKLENGVVIATDVLEDALSVVFGTVIGLLTKPVRALALGLADGLDDITADLAYSQGTVNPDGSIKPDTIWKDLGEAGGALLETATLGLFTFKPSISPFDILFNKIALVDIDFFNIPQEGPGSNKIIRNLRLSIAGWYYIMRNIAAVILLCVLIYVGIRMAISTVASDKAAFKKMLVDWVCSLALIFLIQYIIIFTISVNSAMVRALQDMAGEDPIILANSMQSIKMTAKNWFTIDSIAATIVYCMLIGQTLSLLFTYINRMLKVAFLIIISPLITLTYSMDKMGDGKAQALGTWLKEFIYTVIIQSFHCIIYMVFIKMAVSILDSGLAESYNLAGSFLAVMCVKFTKDAEKILGKIFKFGDSTSDASLGVGMALSAAALSKAKGMGKGTVKAVNGVRNFAHNAAGFAHTWNVSREAMRLRKENSELTMEQAKVQAEEKVSNDEANAAQEKLDKDKYKPSAEERQKLDKRAQDLAAEYKKQGFSDDAAEAKAKAEAANEFIRNKKHPNIARFRGKIQPYQDTWREFRSTEAYKELAGVARGYASAGAALFLGATTYGVTGKGAESILVGTSAFKGTQEIFKSSATTMEDTTESMLRGLDVDSEGQAIAEMENIQARADIYGNEEKLNEEIDSLWNFLDSALHEMDPEGTKTKRAKNTINAIIASEIKKNPQISNDDLMKKIEEKLSQDPQISENMRNKIFSEDLKDEMLNATGENANYRRRKEIYDTMQNASDLNLGPGLFAGMVGKRFRPGIQPQENPQKDFKKHEKRFEKSKDEFDYDNDAHHEQAAAVEYQTQEAMSMQEAKSKMLDSSSAEAQAVHDEIVRKLETATEELTAQAKQEVVDELKNVREKLLKELKNAQENYYECSMTRADSEAGRTHGKRISYVKVDSTERAQAVISEIEQSLKDKFDVEFDDEK